MFRKLILAGVLGVGFLTANAPQAEAIVPGHGWHGAYRVEYRQLHWRERTFSNLFEARSFADLKRAQGFQVDIDRHGLHWHVRFRMTQWRTYRVVNSHAVAHRLEHTLESRGFDARVVH
jgi:hypothetical protein